MGFHELSRVTEFSQMLFNEPYYRKKFAEELGIKEIPKKLSCRSKPILEKETILI